MLHLYKSSSFKKADKAALTTVENQVQGMDTKLNSVVTISNENQAKIQNLENNVAANRNAINHLDNRVNKLEEETEAGFAAAAAHAGLFQPYNVGRLNLTAALGGYKNKTALAIGMGYRTSEKTAFKAGVAADTRGKGVSYNVGVNYEF